MSAALAFPAVLPIAQAVAESAQPGPQLSVVPRRGPDRMAALKVLHRYLQISMLIGRPPSILGNTLLRGRASSHRIPSFENGIIFLFDVEKCLKQLAPFARVVVAHIALEDYTPPEAAQLTGESERTIHRIYGAALEQLADLFHDYGIFDGSVENLSRGDRA